MSGGDSNQQQQQQQQRQMQQQQQQQWAAMQHYQQWWMAVQYPAMAMQQQQMMYNQHYLPYYHHQQQPKQHLPKHRYQIQTPAEDNKTIWIGDLQHWMDEDYLHSCFSQIGEVLSVKIIRNRLTGQSERYGFIEFNSHDAAENALQSYNGTLMPNAEHPFRLNWAGFSTGDRRPEAGSGSGSGSDLSIFVGDLATDVTDELLHDTFASRYPSVKDAKVVVDLNTGRSKGYGFVRFNDENEKSRAVTEMNGVHCSSRPMRVGAATPKKFSSQQQYSSQGQSENESSSTTIFVGGLDSEVTDDLLRESFIPFGEVVSVKIPAGRGCGFVQFAKRGNAEDAIHRLNGTVIGKQKVRLSWGRTLNNKQSRDQWNGAYYPRQGYNGSGYGGAAHWVASPNGRRSREQSVS
ncbi:RNA-binding protein 47B [Perilla frutescens var. hirtella]|uniref:RNA-binding protein 47B n=1 Tax=Perilla frutescens var. hirtella TaxID=608512 RepID=A0AAD4JJB8_PERFH|nr:RNA-binding protein 47B [Perilla frutescens var. hirtella]